MNENLELIKSAAVLEMITVANDFCIFTESIDNQSNEDVKNYFMKVLPLLYLKGALLPDVEVSDEAANERYVTEEHWEEVFLSLEEKLGEDDKYWFADENNDLMKESLADNLADIWQDMKDFITLYQKPSLAAKENAVYECKRLFASHWGRRIPKALHHLHLTIFKSGPEDLFLNF